MPIFAHGWCQRVVNRPSTATAADSAGRMPLRTPSRAAHAAANPASRGACGCEPRPVSGVRSAGAGKCPSHRGAATDRALRGGRNAPLRPRGRNSEGDALGSAGFATACAELRPMRRPRRRRCPATGAAATAAVSCDRRGASMLRRSSLFSARNTAPGGGGARSGRGRAKRRPRPKPRSTRRRREAAAGRPQEMVHDNEVGPRSAG